MGSERAELRWDRWPQLARVCRQGEKLWKHRLCGRQTQIQAPDSPPPDSVMLTSHKTVLSLSLLVCGLETDNINKPLLKGLQKIKYIKRKVRKHIIQYLVLTWIGSYWDTYSFFVQNGDESWRRISEQWNVTLTLVRAVCRLRQAQALRWNPQQSNQV